ncbi:Major sperm protein [Caenorhabditis elegans]|uniref:Major sperm protein n=1 Tax=Caenorhabditis elegans TaxID=6239 RepID=Q9U2A7_CAEEL|nr:Major sperm protein [Caenorhabditis elegans]CAB54441.1 Major sperm protein [Caenorhabditis elegans]|eukprot:NP_496960.1 Major sperm protein [Caenorhabditis elegans]
MALGSIGRRSIRNEMVNAAGDNPSFRGRKVVKPAYEESLLNVEMAERQTAVGGGGGAGSHETRYFGGLIGNKEIFVMTMISVALYLIEGEHAQVVCTALTSVPPAIFSYKVLMNPKSSKEGYHSILFYWTLYGILAVIDQFIGSPQGYNLIKGGLLGAVFIHAFRSNPDAIPPSWKLFVNQATVEMLTSVYTRYDSQGFYQQTESSGFEPRSPTITHFSDVESEYMVDMEQEPLDVSTAVSFLPSLAMQTTQNVSPDYVYNTAAPKTEPLEEESVEPCSTIRINHQKKNFETMSAMTVTCGGAADLVTVPSDRITFSAELRELTIQVTNISQLHVMFALKTNADTHLIAAPTTGIILSGQSMGIRVGVTDNFFKTCADPGKSIDKLAIDYASIPQQLSSSVSKFSPQFFQSQNRRRHAIRVFYQ